ncbi:AbiH family protein [Winogradskyella pulchriflava]|uniref:AbiH family protein n=1 Tax=Winogradskyella pulchriflava TaxID=1110688 RepID=A0ABV6Q809_9FLAO
MPKILITGNGFDLSFGLPTSYNEFINILNSLNSYEEPNFDTIYSHSNNFEKLSEYYKKFDFDLEKTQLLRQSIQDNLWFQFFKNELEIETWIDFENKIEYVLNILFSSINYIKENIFSKGSLSEDKITYNTKLFNNDIEIIQVLNSFNIISVDKDYTITLNLDYFIKKYDFYINVDISAITKKLTEELNVFKRIFNLYFEVFVFPFYDNPRKRFDKNLFSTISKHYTFNYTPTFEKIYKRINKTKFLHGKIDSLSNEIVLGINEIPNDDLDKRFFLPFTKYFQKLNNSTDFEFIGEYEKRKNSNFYFFFFGHSLDSSDADYINEVFDFINQSKSRKKKIIVIYHSKRSKSQLLINLLNIRGKKDIQSLMRNKILDFQHIESKELKTELKRDISSSTRVSVV